MSNYRDYLNPLWWFRDGGREIIPPEKQTVGALVTFRATGVVLVAFYTVAAWYAGLPLLSWVKHFFEIVLEATLGVALDWVIDGGPIELVVAIAETARTLWALEFFRACVYVGFVLAVVWACQAVRGYFRRVSEKESDLRLQLCSAEQNWQRLKIDLDSLDREHQDVLAGLEAIRLASLDSRDQVRSQAASHLRGFVEEILAVHPFDRFNRETHEKLKKWEDRFTSKPPTTRG